MPTIPKYNQGATEEAGLTRAKKRVIGFMEQGILKLTERPAVDLTNGKADSLAEDIIRQMEEISSILRQGNLYFEEMGDVVIVEEYEDVKKILKLVVIARKLTKRLLRGLGSLSKGVSYLDLGVFADLQTAWKELREVFTISSTYLTNIDVELVGDEGLEDRERERLARDLARDYYGDDAEFERFLDDVEDEDIQAGIDSRNRTQANFQKIPDFESLVIELVQLMYNVGEIIIRMKTNFNEARQQRVLPSEAIGEETATSMSGGVYRRPVYRVGNHVLSAMYELDGLPRFI
jgi:hypothetical protein